MTYMADLKVLPRDAVDSDTQRCRMGPALMSGLGLRLGSPVLIRVQQGACLCTAWPRQDLAEGFLQISTQCATPDLSAQTLNGLTVKPAHIKPLTCVKLSCVTLKVFVQSLEYKRKVSEQSVQELLKELLEGLYVHQGHLVDLSCAKTEIRFVQVEKVNSGSQKAGLITARTRVDVNVLQTVKHLERRQEVSASTLGGLEEVYASLKEMITFPLLYPGTLRQLGLSCPRGLLLIGPPGVGKTLLVRCVARDIGATLVTVNGPEVTGSRPGESEENLRRMFDKAREAAEEGPCVLLIDEIDSLCPRRTGSSSAPENRLVAQLLTLMDAIGSHEGFVIIGATNQPDALDPALRRPGRFDREVIQEAKNRKLFVHSGRSFKCQQHFGGLKTNRALDEEIFTYNPSYYRKQKLADVFYCLSSFTLPPVVPNLCIFILLNTKEQLLVTNFLQNVLICVQQKKETF